MVVTSSFTALFLALPIEAASIRDAQWHLRFLKVEEANLITSGEGIAVAVPDTGVHAHADLKKNLLPGTDMISSGNRDGMRDGDGHGTGMAGLIAAHGRDKGIGAKGIAPAAKIMPILYSTKNGHGDSISLASGVQWAITHGADVISISAGGGPSGDLREAIADAHRADAVVVAAAGNIPQDYGVAYPAAYPEVLAVGGSDRKGNRASVSVSGPELDILAPATDIYSTSYDGKYRKGTGTSDAAAIVAGAAALVRSKYPHLPAAEVVHRLTATAVDKGAPGRDDEYGYGVLDIVAALTADVPPLGWESPTAPSAGAGPTSPTAAGPETPPRNNPVVVAVGLLVSAAAVGALVFLRRRQRRGAGAGPPAPPTR
jgi:type VII secretion-associated serine protease mycosin